jgi:dihydrofolate reductase
VIETGERADGGMGQGGLWLVLVVAIADNGVIGRDNAVPWRLKSDMRHFRELTWGKPVVMGRRTYRSIPKPLKGRTTIVLSRSDDFESAAVVVAPSLETGLDVARGDALRRGTDAIMVIGGQDLFAESMRLADRLEVTYVRASPEGDTYFPPIDPDVWREVDRREYPSGPDDEFPFAFVTYRRAG